MACGAARYRRTVRISSTRGCNSIRRDPRRAAAPCCRRRDRRRAGTALRARRDRRCGARSCGLRLLAAASSASAACEQGPAHRCERDRRAPSIDDAQFRAIHSAARAGEQPGRRGRDLVGGYVAKALCDIPSMTERVDDLAVELAPELFGELVVYRGAGGERACPDCTRIAHLELEDRGGPTDRERRDDAGSRKLARHVEVGVAHDELE